MARIILAHGILGFGSVFPDQPINYFNGIKKFYASLGHEVECPSVTVLASITTRAADLEAAILKRWPDNTEPLYIIAHSMGGLDCRRLIATSEKLKDRFKRLINIATPHFGSPVADVVLNPPLMLGISPVQRLINFFANDEGGLKDLQTRNVLQDEDVAGVEYLCIGCDSTTSFPHSPLFAATWLAGQQVGVLNDGMISLTSASKTNNASDLWDIWPVDHGGAIGWPTGGAGKELMLAMNSPPQAHLDRYEKLLASLIK
jgi:pimeloyl-ACP methyl ester carboxylesterase